MRKNRKELEENLIEVLHEKKHDRKFVRDIKKQMGHYKVLPGDTLTYVNQPEEYTSKFSESLLCALTKKTYELTHDTRINPEDYFSPRQIKEVETNFVVEKSKSVSFPYTFENVLKIADDNYVVKLDGQTAVKFMESQLLQWNPETQREARIRKVVENGEERIIETPKIIEKSVSEIEDLTLKGKLIISMLTFNARLGSSDDESGEELIYDEDNKTLTITKGTLLDVLDGFHRLTGVVRELKKHPELNHTFILNIINYDKGRAKEQFNQINTTNPISKSHMKKMKEERFGDFISSFLEANSELKNKVTNADRISPYSDILVTFKTLSDIIDETFHIENKGKAIKIAKYLKDFINELFFAFPNEFMGNIVDIRKSSLINTNVMFNGYITLAKRMQKEGISVDEVENIIKTIDFSRDNKLWHNLKIVDENNNITNLAKDNVIKYFNEINLINYKEGVRNG